MGASSWRSARIRCSALLLVLLGCGHADSGFSLDSSAPYSVEQGDRLDLLELTKPRRSAPELARRAADLASLITGRRCRWTEAMRWATAARRKTIRASPLRCDRDLELEYDFRWDVLAVGRRPAEKIGTPSGGSVADPSQPTVGMARARAASARFLHERLADSGLVGDTWRLVGLPVALPPTVRRRGYGFSYARTHGGVQLSGTLLRIGVDDVGVVAKVVLADVRVRRRGTRTAARGAVEARAWLEQQLAEDAEPDRTVRIESADVVYDPSCPGREGSAPILSARINTHVRGGTVGSITRVLSLVDTRPRLKPPGCAGHATVIP